MSQNLRKDRRSIEDFRNSENLKVKLLNDFGRVGAAKLNVKDFTDFLGAGERDTLSEAARALCSVIVHDPARLPELERVVGLALLSGLQPRKGSGRGAAGEAG